MAKRNQQTVFNRFVTFVSSYSEEIRSAARIALVIGTVAVTTFAAVSCLKAAKHSIEQQHTKIERVINN